MRITDFLPRGVFPASAALLLACGGPSQQAARTPVSLVQATDAVPGVSGVRRVGRR